MAILRGLKGKLMQIHFIDVAACWHMLHQQWLWSSTQGYQHWYEEQKSTDTGPHQMTDWSNTTLTEWCMKKTLHTKTSKYCTQSNMEIYSCSTETSVSVYNTVGCAHVGSLCKNQANCVNNSHCRLGGEWFGLHQSHHGQREGELRRKRGADTGWGRRRHPCRGGQTKAKDDHHVGDILDGFWATETWLEVVIVHFE